MTDFYHGKIPIIKRSLDEGFVHAAAEEVSFGCIPRDYSIDPVAMGDSPAGLQLISDSELDAYFDEQEAQQSSLEHMYLNNGAPAFQFLDQNGFPDCWVHSTAHAMMLDYMKRKFPIVRLNAVGAATLMNETNGGWCGLSAKYARRNGMPEVGNGPGQWPYQSRRGHDTAELRASMATHKSEEDWYDLGKQEWDQELSRAQLKTLGNTNVPCPADWNRFSHSMCIVRTVRVERGHWSPLILNSWKGFGYFGLAVLLDMWPDNAVGIRSTTSAPV